MLYLQRIKLFAYTLRDFAELYQLNIKQWLLKNNHKVSALVMAGKMLSVLTLFSLIPVGSSDLASKPIKANIKLDTSKSLALSSQTKEIKLEIGDSNFDQEVAKASAQTQVVYADTSTHNDPSDFRSIYRSAGARFGIPWQLIEAVHEVESGKSGSTSKSSGAGAMGPMQFMPGTWRTYQVDGNGDGVADATDVVDAIYGAANLLAQSGAADGDIDSALFNYNHAQWYVNKVKAIAYEIGM